MHASGPLPEQMAFTFEIGAGTCRFWGTRTRGTESVFWVRDQVSFRREPNFDLAIHILVAR